MDVQIHYCGVILLHAAHANETVDSCWFLIWHQPQGQWRPVYNNFTSLQQRYIPKDVKHMPNGETAPANLSGARFITADQVVGAASSPSTSFSLDSKPKWWDGARFSYTVGRFERVRSFTSYP